MLGFSIGQNYSLHIILAGFLEKDEKVGKGDKKLRLRKKT